LQKEQHLAILILTVMKYNVRQALALLDILVKRCKEEKSTQNPKYFFEEVEKLFPLQTKFQITDVEKISKENSQEAEVIIG